MEEWGIPREKVLTMIIDNGSKMVAWATHTQKFPQLRRSMTMPMMTMHISLGRVTGNVFV